MKLGLLTFHYCCNPGAVLQAYALQTYLRSLGQEPVFINYKLDVLTRRYDPWLPLKNEFRDIKSLWNLKNLSCGLLFSFSRYFKFKIFRKKFLTESDNGFCDEYSKIIIGSDQVWNTAITHGLNNYYWGHFRREKDCKIYSYAASAGEIRNEDETFVRKSLSAFHGISVREMSLLERLDGLSIHSSLVLDPVFLLTAAEWAKLVHSKNQKHICVYNILGVPLVKTLAEKISDNTGLEISSCIRTKYRTALSPQEFLNAVYNSEYVVTSSFHGLAFAVIFNKKFWVPNIEGPKGERIRSLLSILGLEDRVVFEERAFDFNKQIDWSMVNKRLEREVAISKKYIEFIINS